MKNWRNAFFFGCRMLVFVGCGTSGGRNGGCSGGRRGAEILRQLPQR